MQNSLQLIHNYYTGNVSSRVHALASAARRSKRMFSIASNEIDAVDWLGKFYQIAKPCNRDKFARTIMSLIKTLRNIIACFFILSIIVLLISPWGFYLAIPSACNGRTESAIPSLAFAVACIASAPFAAGGYVYFLTKHKGVMTQQFLMRLRIFKLCVVVCVSLPFWLELIECSR